MDDPTPDLISKLFSSLGSILGASVFLGILKPASFEEGVFRILAAFVTAFCITEALIIILKLPENVDVHLGLGFVIGLLTWIILALLLAVYKDINNQKEGILQLLKRLFTGS